MDGVTYADYLTWDKLTEDGCWGSFDLGSHSPEQLRKKGETFWTTFIAKRSQGLKEILETAYHKKLL
ncbi:hypothetical protein [Priestia megaterium]|uniref:hypothetical protein n=1 Tax=Priestia megaterium TaxID=1404 RepID=UPI002877EC94|nr:hypothetical protein [Priestia megaterium]MBX4163355.1 hypothetical protein [Priestia megaterium]